MRFAVVTFLWVAALGEKCHKPHCLCDDSCIYSGDGQCDDSGPGARAAVPVGVKPQRAGLCLPSLFRPLMSCGAALRRI